MLATSAIAVLKPETAIKERPVRFGTSPLAVRRVAVAVSAPWMIGATRRASRRFGPSGARNLVADKHGSDAEHAERIHRGGTVRPGSLDATYEQAWGEQPQRPEHQPSDAKGDAGRVTGNRVQRWLWCAPSGCPFAGRLLGVVSRNVGQSVSVCPRRMGLQPIVPSAAARCCRCWWCRPGRGR